MVLDISPTATATAITNPVIVTPVMSMIQFFSQSNTQSACLEYTLCPNTEGRFVPSRQANRPCSFRSIRMSRISKVLMPYLTMSTR